MADETNEPQTEGAPKKRPTPVNNAIIEAQERDISLEPVKTEKPAKPVKAAKPEPAPDAEAPAEPAPEAAAPQPPAEGPEERSLAELAEAGSKGRLSNAAEERATTQMKDGLLEGGEAFLGALDAMPKLPWILAVRAVEQAWPLLVPEARPFLLDGLARMEGLHSARLRLSVSRALMRLDLPVAVKIAASVCTGFVNPADGSLTPDQSKLVGNVFIGRGKPWVLQLPLESLDDAESTAIVSALVFSVFNVNNPPITQLSILRYGAARLGSMHPNLQEMVAKNVARWNGKWQTALRRDCPVLPEGIASVLKAEQSGEERNQRGGNVPETAEADTQPPLPPELEEKLKQAAEAGDADGVAAATQEINAWLETQRVARRQQQPPAEAGPQSSENEDDNRRNRGRDRGRSRGGDRGGDQRGGDQRERPQERPKERPAYVSREQEVRGSIFNLSDALRGIEKYVSQLRNDLGAMQIRIRRAEDGGGRSRRPSDRVILSVEEANLSSEELKRLVVQLEGRVADQEARIAELMTDSEMRSVAMTPGPDGVTPDAATQLRTLLALKLNEDWADYLALENQEPDLVIQQHHRSILRNVFGVLLAENVGLTPNADLPPPPPEVLPPPPTPVIDEEEADEDDDELDAIPEPEPVNLDDEDDDELDAIPEPVNLDDAEGDSETPSEDDGEVAPLEGEQPDDPSEPPAIEATPKKE